MSEYASLVKDFQTYLKQGEEVHYSPYKEIRTLSPFNLTPIQKESGSLDEFKLFFEKKEIQKTTETLILHYKREGATQTLLEKLALALKERMGPCECFEGST